MTQTCSDRRKVAFAKLGASGDELQAATVAFNKAEELWNKTQQSYNDALQSFKQEMEQIKTVEKEINEHFLTMNPEDFL